MDPYLEVVADELQELNKLKICDAYQNAMFSLKIEILLNIMDYAGIGKVFKVSGSGAYKGCMWCDIKDMKKDYINIYLHQNSQTVKKGAAHAKKAA